MDGEPHQEASRPGSRLATPLLFGLLPSTIIGLCLYPAVAIASLVPLLGFIALPTLLGLSLFLLYSLPFTLYLLFAQRDAPHNAPSLFLPWQPYRCLQVWLHVLRTCREALSAGMPSLWLDWLVRRVLVLGGKERDKVLKENVKYWDGDADTGPKRLDVYFPLNPRGEDGDGIEDDKVPTIVYIGGGGHMFWSKGFGAQVALRLRKLGFLVVVPDVCQWPQGKAMDAVADVRRVLAWTGDRIESFGGDVSQIYLMGYGSGGHVSLLTVVQDAVVMARDKSSSDKMKRTKSFDSEPITLSAGIRRCRLPPSAANTSLPPIAGVICVSGVFDVVKQLRTEGKGGMEQLSALRRTCGPSTGANLLSCPSHLLYGASQILHRSLLPPKFLFIAGGKDLDVPYSQSVLMKSLLVGIGVEEVRLKLYREVDHWNSLASLMTQTRHSTLFLSEIENLINSEY